METLSISTLGSHSALDVCEGAKKEGFKTSVVCQKGRETTYAKYYRSRKRGKEEVGIVDDILLLEKFGEIVRKENTEWLKKRNSVFVPNRSMAVYVGYDAIEKQFDVPIFGNRFLLRAEERHAPNNQYDLMKKGGIRFPQSISDPKNIDRLCIVKVNEATRTYERAFFLCASYEEYVQKSGGLLKEGKITREDLAKAKIEEYILGAQFNFNFFYSPIHKELELLGIDTRRQTNIDGYLRMPCDVQGEALKIKQPSTIEVGHIACTLRESLLDQAFELGEKMVSAVQKTYKHGLIGPFALQGAIVEEGKEEFVCFDVSFRMPGSPGTRFTPYSSYLFGEGVSFGRRIAMEIKDAQKKRQLDQVTT